MFLERIRARRAIERRFAATGYRPSAETWYQLHLAVARDLQAQQLPPNVPVPSRRRALGFLKTIYKATGSIPVAVSALFRAGSWTSSGGSFRLADKMGVDIAQLVEKGIDSGGFTLLEVGGGWAGFHARQAESDDLSLGHVARLHKDHLGSRLHLHFTNLTQWHPSLPRGVTEHPYITAANLSAAAINGIEPGTADLIYSQAAAYFEPDIETFVRSAAAMLRPGGQLLFNYPLDVEPDVLMGAASCGLQWERSLLLGGMNGQVALFTKRVAALTQTSRPAVPDDAAASRLNNAA